jgi:hypothetical protein
MGNGYRVFGLASKNSSRVMVSGSDGGAPIGTNT